MENKLILLKKHTPVWQKTGTERYKESFIKCLTRNKR